MKHLSLVLAAAALIFTMGAASADYTPPKWPEASSRMVVTAFYDSKDQVQALAQEHAPWQVDKRKQFVTLDVDEAEFQDLLGKGFRVQFDEPRSREFNRVRVADPAQRAGIPGFACYRTVTETLADAAAMASDFPDLASVIDIGDSWEKSNGLGGEDLLVLKLTNSNIGGDKPKLFAMSAIHAREYTTAELNTRFAEYLLNNYGTDADATWLLDHHEMHLLLQTNPDGRKKAQTGLFWRKNANQNYCGSTSNSRGADLNRNFEFGWGCCNGSSGSQCNDTYRGAAPGSEFEVAAVQDYIRTIFPDARGPNPGDAAPADTPGIFIDIHSFSELVLYPWGYTPTAAPNRDGMRTLARRLAFFNGYAPQQATELYITDGTTDDFAYGDLGIPAYTYELGTSFFQNCGVFESQILPDNLQSLIYAAKNLRTPYLTPGGPSTLNVLLSPAGIVAGDTVTLSANVTDTPFEQSEGVEPTQIITAAQFTIDTPPWEAAAQPVTLAAADGSFNFAIEDVTGSVTTSGLAEGRHTVYVRGQDASGQWGPVSARFLYVLDPATSPRFTGEVRAADTGAPLAATITAGNFSTTTDVNGDYELMLLPGSYEITVTPDDATYGAQTAASVSIASQQTLTADFLLYPFCDLLNDDMETTDVPWIAGGNWARTQSQSNSGSWSWTDSPSGEYPNFNDTSLTSPVLDLSNYAGAIDLSFAHRCITESGYDYCRVEISSDGSSWTEVTSFDGTANAFSSESYDVSALAGSTTAQLRFRLTSDVSITRDGWYVDDVALRGSGAACVAAADSDGDGVSDPVDNCTLVANPDQRDSNGDGFGNVCDADLNNDSAVNLVDLIAFKAVFGSNDADADLNGDGVVNLVDLVMFKARFAQPPGPAGGL